MPVAQPTGPVSQFTASQILAGTSQKSTTSVDVHQHSVTDSSDMPVLQPANTGSACSDHEQQTNLTFPVYPEEEGEVSDQEAGMPEQDSDQHISEEHTYRETVRCKILCRLVPGV